MPLMKVFVVGDSGALGAGVAPEETYAYQVAKQLSAEKKQSIELYNLGYNAAGYCIYLQELHRHLDLQIPDLVIVHMFADDLEQKALVMSGGVLRADPARLETSVLRHLLSNSYTFNWIWWKSMTWIVTKTTDGGTRVPKWVETGPRLIPQKTQQNFTSSIVHLKKRLTKEDIDHVFFLASPAGWSLCPDNPSPTSECGWLEHDQTNIARLLDSTGVPWLDFRMIWNDSDQYVLRQERQFFQRYNRLPVHPNKDGHAKIFTELWPHVQLSLQE